MGDPRGFTLSQNAAGSLLLMGIGKIAAVKNGDSEWQSVYCAILQC
jgi:hypothetical protein